MNVLQTIILSIVEGITEFLPISSTGHLILTSSLLNIPQTEFVKSFEIVIQLGAILAVVVIYFKKLWNNFKLWKKVLIAFLPSVVFGLIFYDFIKSTLIGNNNIVIISLLIGGIVMLLFEKYYYPKKVIKNYELKIKNLIVIGLLQSVSMIPGVSRAFATIFGGMLVGMDRKRATEFSFFLAIPTMAAATGLDLVKTDLTVWTNEEYKLLSVGFVVSFLTAYVVVKWLIKFVQNNNFNIFAWYRIVLAIFFILLQYN